MVNNSIWIESTIYDTESNAGDRDGWFAKLTPKPINQAPVAFDYSATKKRNQTVAIDVLNNDQDDDGDILTISNYDAISNHGGTITSNQNQQLVYLPSNNFTGTDTFKSTLSENLTLTVY